MSQPTSTPSSKIFISYRRDDSAGHTGRLYDRLSAHFGEDQIFMDIEHIEAGEDFVQAIREAVGGCEVLIALIGRNWLNSGGAAGRRLDDPNDFVRLEIAAALERNVRVIPVLVQEAKMPRPQDLPENLLRLSHRNAIQLSDTRWKHDVEQLIEALEKILARQRASQSKAVAEAEAERQRLEAQARRQEEAQAKAAETRRREGEAAEARKRHEAEETRKRREEEAREIEQRRAARREPHPVKETSAQTVSGLSSANAGTAERSESPQAGYAAQPTQSKRTLVLVVVALLVIAVFGVMAAILIPGALTPAADKANSTDGEMPSPAVLLQSNQQTAQQQPTQPTPTNDVEQARATASPTLKGKAGDNSLTGPAVNKQGEAQPTPIPALNKNNTAGVGRAVEEKDGSPAPAPTPAQRPRAPISGGILNGKAMSKPPPAYPAIAKAARASGTVTVQVTVDESGKVISARAAGGNPLLQQAAVQAAYQARFSPTLVSGQPVKVNGVLTYNFVLQ